MKVLHATVFCFLCRAGCFTLNVLSGERCLPLVSTAVIFWMLRGAHHGISRALPFAVFLLHPLLFHHPRTSYPLESRREALQPAETNHGNKQTSGSAS